MDGLSFSRRFVAAGGHFQGVFKEQINRKSLIFNAFNFFAVVYRWLQD